MPIVGFAWANYKVFQKQEGRVSELREAIQFQEIRISNLMITPDPGSPLHSAARLSCSTSRFQRDVFGIPPDDRKFGESRLPAVGHIKSISRMIAFAFTMAS